MISDFDDDLGPAPKRDVRPIPERRADAVRMAELYQAEYYLERAAWTDEQWVADDARIEQEIRLYEERKAEQAAREHRRALELAGWPERALDAAAVADTNVAAIKRITEWDPKARNVLVLSGPPGVGKTTAAAYRALQARAVVQFVRASAFARTSRYGEERQSWLDAGALCLDDLGAEYADAKGSFLTDLDELVDTYYGDRGALIITTNLTSADFKARYGERVTDRLRECGQWFEIRAESMRGKGKP